MPDQQQAAVDTAAEVIHKRFCSRREMTAPFADCANHASHQRAARELLEAAAPHLAAAERARCLAEIEQFKTIMAGPVNGHLTDAVRIQTIRHVLINGPAPVPTCEGDPQ